MSFSDNFNRSDSSLSVSPNWTTYNTSGSASTIIPAGNNADFRFVNNKLVAGSLGYGAVARVNTSAETFADDQEATVYISDIVSSRAANGGRGDNLISGFNSVGVAVRVQDTGACYVALVDPFSSEGIGGIWTFLSDENGDIEYHILEPDDFPDMNTYPNHWSNAIGGDWTDTDDPNKLTLRVHGNVLTVLVNDVIQVIYDVSQSPYMDSNDLLTSGQPGIYYEGYGHQGGNVPLPYDFGMDNFSAVSHPAFIDDFSRDSNASQSIETSPYWSSPIPGLKVKNGRISSDETPIMTSGPFLAVSCLANLSGANQVVSYTHTLSDSDDIGIMPALRVNPSTGECYEVFISNSESNNVIASIWYQSSAGHTQMTSLKSVTGVSNGDTIDLVFRANGDILTLLINDAIIHTVTIGSVNRIDSGSPGLIGFNNIGDTSTTNGLDEFSAIMYYDDPVPVTINPEVYLSMVGRTTNLHHSITDHDENAFYEAEELVGSTFIPSDLDGDGDLSDEPPALGIFDPYYSSGRYNYRDIDEWGVDFSNTIFNGTGPGYNIFDLTPSKLLPPIVAKRAGTTNSEFGFHLLVFPEGRNNHANSIYVAGSAPSISYRILNSSGQVIDDDPKGYPTSPSYYGVPYQSIPANKARHIYVETSFYSVDSYLVYDKYEDLNLPADDISVLKDDLSTQTFTSFTDLSSASDVSSILEYPSGPNYVILEYTITTGFFNTATTEDTRSTFVLTQRVYEDPENSVANIQSINTPGTGNPDDFDDVLDEYGPLAFTGNHNKFSIVSASNTQTSPSNKAGTVYGASIIEKTGILTLSYESISSRMTNEVFSDLTEAVGNIKDQNTNPLEYPEISFQSGTDIVGYVNGLYQFVYPDGTSILKLIVDGIPGLITSLGLRSIIQEDLVGLTILATENGISTPYNYSGADATFTSENGIYRRTGSAFNRTYLYADGASATWEWKLPKGVITFGSGVQNINITTKP